jgi:hypothetical protein
MREIKIEWYTEVTLTWSHQEPNGDTPYLGDAGESTMDMSEQDLLTLLREGMRDEQGNVVTTVTIWPHIPDGPKP